MIIISNIQTNIHTYIQTRNLKRQEYLIRLKIKITRQTTKKFPPDLTPKLPNAHRNGVEFQKPEKSFNIFIEKTLAIAIIQALENHQ